MGTAFLCAFHPLFLCFFLTFSVYIFLIRMNVQTFRSLVLQAGQQGLRRKKELLSRKDRNTNENRISWRRMKTRPRVRNKRVTQSGVKMTQEGWSEWIIDSPRSVLCRQRASWGHMYLCKMTQIYSSCSKSHVPSTKGCYQIYHTLLLGRECSLFPHSQLLDQLQGSLQMPQSITKGSLASRKTAVIGNNCT